MSLLAYNLTTAPLALAAGSPIVTLPASPAAGARGPAFNVTGELKGLTVPQYTSLQAQVGAGSMELEWTGLPEYNTHPLVVGSAQDDIDDIPIDIFVNPTTGSDDNDGSATFPFQTLLRAFQAVPAVWKKSCKIHGQIAGNYPFDTSTGDFVVLAGKPVGPNSHTLLTGLDIVGPAIDQLGALTAIAPTAGTTVVAAVVTTNGTLRGAYVRNTVTGFSSRIVDNVFAAGNTTFTLNVGASIGVGTSFVVEKAGMNIQVGTGGALVLSAGFFNLENVKISSAGGPGALLLIAGGGGLVSFDRSELDVNGRGVGINVFARMDSSSGSGVYVHNGPFNFGVLTINQSGQLAGNWMIDNGLFFTVNNAMVELGNIQARGTTFVVGSPAAATFISGSITGGGLPGLTTQVLAVGRVVLGANPDGSAAANALDISAPIGFFGPIAGVQVTRNGCFANKLTGTNTSYGLVAAQGAQLAYDPVNTTITGTLGNTLVGTFPKAYAALPFTDPTTLSRISSTIP